VELGILGRETELGVDHAARVQELTAQKTAAEQRLAGLHKRWDEEKRLVGQIQELSGKLTVPDKAGPGQHAARAPDPAEVKRLQGELAQRQDELARVQGDAPLVRPFVDSQTVAAVVSGWTGIPLGKMVLDEIQTVLELESRLRQRIIGQDHALQALARRIQTARANLVDPHRPIGVFLLVGPSGVGKTETAMALADILYGGERGMVIINMSEYKEEEKISRLTGASPGYAGYGEGGVLTEPVLRKPYSVVLLDEVEKANVGVQEIFYQVFDKGMLMDGKGTEVNFKNTILLLTSNVGTDTIMKVSADPDTRPDAEGLATVLRPDLLKAFKPALLGRLTVVPYFPLSDEVLRQIIHLQLKRITDRVKTNYRAEFRYDEAVINTIASRCKEVESGARNVDQILTGTLLPEISRQLLARMGEGQPIVRIQMGVGPDGGFTYQIQ
jgi:type VI secretion system protein VasG